MEAYREKEEFKPVHIVLKSQEEIDQLFSVADFSPITYAFKNCNENYIDQLHELLMDYCSNDYERFHNILNKHLMYKE